MLETITYYVNLIGICTIFTMSIIVAVLYYFLKVKKIAARVENINTSYFKREDSVSYVPFKDVVSVDGGLDTDGMYVMSDTVFVAGISVRGFDYASASVSERVDAQIQSVTFFNGVETPTSFRQTLKSADLSANIADYEGQLKRIAKEQMELDAEYQATLMASEDYVDEPNIYQAYKKRIEELLRDISAKEHMQKECQALIRYMNVMSGDAGNKESVVSARTAQIMFSYVHNPDSYTEELTKEEIYLKAQAALHSQAEAYKEALAFCHFKAKRLTARELIGLVYECTSPVTGGDTDISELLDSSYTSLFVSSDSLVEAQMEKIGLERYNKQLEEYEKKLSAMLKQQQLDRERAFRMLSDETYEKATKEYDMRQEVGYV